MIKKEHIITSPKVDDEKNIMVLSDLHYNSQNGINKLRLVNKTAFTEDITHIVIPGDLYDGSDENIYRNSHRITGFLDSISRYAPVCYVQGNSEQDCRYLPDFLWDPASFFSGDVHIIGNLDSMYNPNYSYSTGDVTIVGLGLDKRIYKLDDKHKPQAIAKSYSKWFSILDSTLCKDRFNILVCHDPMVGESLSYLNIDPNLFDLIITGHKHGAVYPADLVTLLATSKELSSEAFPKYQEGFYDIDGVGAKMFVSGGITEYTLENSELEASHEGTIDFIRIRKP